MATERQHALLAPSAAYRWLMCPKSARQEEKFEDKASIYADEGTLAHNIAELLIKYMLGRIDFATYQEGLTVYQEDELYEEEMLDYCNDYAEFVIEKYNEVKAHTPDAQLHTEVEVDLRMFIPESWGHIDVVIIGDGVLIIIDLKYGKGKPVSAFENKQAMIYGLGAIAKAQLLYEVGTVEMIIHQPRLDSITDFTMPVDELLSWASNELQAKAQLAYDGEGEYVPGDHCDFCKFRVRCKALADYNLEIAKHEFAQPDALSDEDIADILSRILMLENWATAVKTYALNEAVNNNKKWPGFKLVEGRSNRKYADEKKAEDVLIAHDFKPDIIFKPKKLFGITELQKRIGTVAFKNYIEPLLIKPNGKPVLVSIDDKRPELNSIDKAREDFSE